MVVLIFSEVESADQAANRTVSWVHCDQRRFDLWHLCDAKHAFVVLRNAHHGAAPQPLARWSGVGQRVSNEANTLPIKRVHLALATCHDHTFGVRFQHDSREQVVGIRKLCERGLQCLGQRLFGFCALDLRRKLHITFRAAKALTPLVIQHATSQRLVRRFLVAGFDRRGDGQATRIRRLTDKIKYELAGHFVKVRRVHCRRRISFDGRSRYLSRFIVGIVDVFELVHSAQHILLP